MKKLLLLFSQLALLLMLVFTANGVVSAKVASGVKKLGGGLSQGQNPEESLLRLGSSDISTIDALGSSLVTKGAGKGLETLSYKLQLGERTIQGQVDATTQTGNSTIQRGGQDLVRLRSGGHGQAGATATPQNVRNVALNGRVFTGKGADRAVTSRDIRELYKAKTGQRTSTIRTRSGR